MRAAGTWCALGGVNNTPIASSGRERHDGCVDGLVMRALLVVLLAVHAAIHLLGFARAFGLTRLATEGKPPSRRLGALWLLASMGLFASAVVLAIEPSSFWMAGLPAVALSQLLIVTSWRDAKFGTLVNAVIVIPIVLSTLDLRETSFRSVYRRDVERGLATASTSREVTDADLAALPAPLRRYLTRAEVVGRSRTQDLEARWRGEMKRSFEAGWMPVRVEQYDRLDEPARYFIVNASVWGVPFEALHRYEGGEASMQVRVLSLFDVVDARGSKMTQSETVTLFNDMCLLAPASLVGAPVEWREIDARTVTGRFTNAGHTIGATLSFDADGDLVDFVSEDRYASADGVTYESHPWSTPIRAYRRFDGRRVPSFVEAVWRRPDGDFVYARYHLEGIRYDLRGRAAVAPSGARETTSLLGVKP